MIERKLIMHLITEKMIDSRLVTLNFKSLITGSKNRRKLIVPENFSEDEIQKILQKCLKNVEMISLKTEEPTLYYSSSTISTFSTNSIDQYWKDGTLFFINFYSTKKERCYLIAVDDVFEKSSLETLVTRCCKSHEEVTVSKWDDCWIKK